MSERRRMMAGDSGFISQNLLLWFDGKEYLDDSKWYPKILQNGELVKYSNYLSKYGSCSYNSTKGCFSKVANVAGYYYSSSNFITSIKGSKLGDFTFLTHVDLTTVRNSNYNEVYLFGSSYSGGSGYGRGYMVLYSSGQLRFAINNGSWVDATTTTSIPVNFHVISLAVVRSGSTISFFVNGQKLGSDLSCSNYNFTHTDTKLNNYDGGSNTSNANKTNALDYYSCAIYDRALTSDEIANMCKYLNNRYNLKV